LVAERSIDMYYLFDVSYLYICIQYRWYSECLRRPLVCVIDFRSLYNM